MFEITLSILLTSQNDIFGHAFRIVLVNILQNLFVKLKVFRFLVWLKVLLKTLVMTHIPYSKRLLTTIVKVFIIADLIQIEISENL